MTAHLGTADLHIHTNTSDGKYGVQTLLEFVALNRPHLDVIAITDHDKLDSALWAYERRHLYPFDIVPGIEVSSQAGHILALWVTRPIPAHMSLEETAQAIREAGGISILAHPFHIEMDFVRRNARRFWNTPEVLLSAGIHGVEVHNAGIVTPLSNWTARLMAKRIGITQLGNSDAHTLGAIGAGRTRFAGKTADDLRNAIVNATTTAEGSAWKITDYIEYLLKEPQPQAMNSLANISFSHPMTD